MYYTKDELLQAIQERFPKLGRGQKKVAQYVLTHTEEVAFLTAAQLGKKVGVSEATVVRFASLLGYKGFPDFQARIQNMMRQDMSTISRLEKRAEQHTIHPEGSILQEILKADQMNLSLFSQDTSEEDFSRAVDMIVEARAVYICGLRVSYSLASFLWFSLRYVLHNVYLVTPCIGDLPEQLLLADERDVMLAVSLKRYYRMTIDIARALKNRQVSIVAITDNLLSPIAEVADVQFTVRTDVSTFIGSQVVPMSLANALITAIALKHKSETFEELGKLEDSFQEFGLFA